MVKIGSQDERPGDGGLNADNKNGSEDSAGADSSAASPRIADGPDNAAARTPHAAGIASTDDTVIMDRAGGPGGQRQQSPSGSPPPEDQHAASFNVWERTVPGPHSPETVSPIGSEPSWPAAPSEDITNPHAVSPASGLDHGPAEHAGPGWEGSGWGGSGSPGGPASPAPGSPRGKRRLVPLVGIAAAIALVVAGVGVYLSQKSSPAHAAAGSERHEKAASSAKAPEHVVSVTPANGATGVNGAATISVVFSQPLSTGSPMPSLKPALHGTWHVHGNRAEFVPARGFRPRTNVTLKIPAGASGVRSSHGGLLASPVIAKFRTGTYSTVRIEQLLAQLGYLPLTWAPQSGAAPALKNRRAQVSAAYSPPPGTYTWQAGYPAALKRLWKPDAPSEVLRGAVMAFQADQGLMSDMVYENQVGLTLKGPLVHRLWKALFRAAAKGEVNQHGYTYALASQHSPETLTVWHDGRQIFKHLANTGIPVAPTAVRTDPVYIRLQHQIMKGRNPDGTKYADPVAWVAYFHGGEAVHYFPRASYGYPQSLGCVELPWSPAKRIWPYLTYGTLVTVTKA